MAWTTDPKAPIVRHGRWTPNPAAPESAVPGAWRPIPGRIGTELLDLDERGAIVASASGDELLNLIERGVIAAPELAGVELLDIVERGLVGPGVRGVETSLFADAGSLRFDEREYLTIEESGMALPPGYGKLEAIPFAEFGLIGPIARGIEDAPTYIESGQGWFAWEDIADVTVTATGYSRTTIPVRCRYIDVILLGAGGGGAGGYQGIPAQDGYGGQAGKYSSFRYDRGEGRNTWFYVSIEIGVGGGGGSRNNNGAGTAGGATKMWIDLVDAFTGLTLEGAGGAGGSGRGFGIDRSGKAPGNHTFQGKTASGGGANGGTPGGGGQGGGGSSWPANAGSGSGGARGQAWIRFSH